MVDQTKNNSFLRCINVFRIITLRKSILTETNQHDIMTRLLKQARFHAVIELLLTSLERGVSDRFTEFRRDFFLHRLYFKFIGRRW